MMDVRQYVDDPEELFAQEARCYSARADDNTISIELGYGRKVVVYSGYRRLILF